MKLSVRFPYSHERTLQWPEIMAWGLCVFACGVLVLLLAVPERTMLWSMVPYTLTFFCSSLIFMNSVLQNRGKTRWALMCCALSVLGSGIVGVLSVTIQLHITTYEEVAPTQEKILFLAYIFGLMATAIYFPRKVLFLGSIWHIILNSIVVGIASLTILQSGLSFVVLNHALDIFSNWRMTSETSGMVLFISFDVGLLFAFFLLCIRLGRSASPFYILIFLSLLCLTLADVFYLLLSFTSDPEVALQTTIPLYMLRVTIWALGAHWHIKSADSDSAVMIETQEMTYVEWFAWTRVAPLTILVAFAFTTLLVPAQPETLIALLVLAAIREIATHQEYGLMQLLKRSKAEADSARAQVEETNQRLQATMAQIEDLAVEQERVRVAREIHDGLGHHLNNVKVHVGVAYRAFEADPPVALDSLSIAKTEIRNAQRELRHAVDALVSNDHLARSLEDLLSEPIRDCQLAGISVDFAVIGTPRSPSEQIKHVLYRIGQEALNNVRQHARAKRATFQIHYQEQQIQIVVEDDGVGLPDSVEQRRGHGLDNLQERAALIGGKTTIETRPGQGVRVVVEVPYGPDKGLDRR